jgi:hypothetical protein
MKGTLYGGIICKPDHPEADMHGLLRCIIRARSKQHVADALHCFGVTFDWFADFNSGVWSESKSAAEVQAAEGRYGIVLVCPLVQAYLRAENYKPLKEKECKAT